MRFLYRLLFKQDVDNKLMINAGTFSMLESPQTYDYDEMENSVSKSNCLEPTINN